jgi:lysophospholipase L1-like esterase
MTRMTTSAAATAVLLGILIPARAQTGNQNWVVGWSTSQQRAGDPKITNATVRLIARVTTPGEVLRVRLANTFGAAPVTLEQASVAARVRGAAVALGTIKPLTFAGSATVTIPPGGTAESDPVAMHVDAQQDVAISLYVSGSDIQASQHGGAQVTSYLTDDGAGDQTRIAEAKPFTRTTTSMLWLKAVDVRSATPVSAIVAFGDSITDGTCTTLDAHDRWEDIVAQRFALQPAVRYSVVNEGIGGNTLLENASYNPPTNSPAGLMRFERDVLSHPGVSHVVLFEGTNDIRRGATADDVINALKELTRRARAKGFKVIGATIIPRHVMVPGVADTGWTDDKSRIRARVNAWIRNDAGFDAVLDFDRVVRSAGNPDLIEPAYNCGDGVHPSPIGYFQMGRSVDLRVFDAPRRTRGTR